MKKNLLIIFISVLLFQNAKAQISYESSYPVSTTVNLKYFNQNGQKWMMMDTSFIYLYNLDHSLFRQIPSFFGNVYFVSDDLFDNDPLTIEFLIVRGTTMPSITVFRENGAQLLFIDSATIFSAAMMSNREFSSSVFATDSGTKMMVMRYDSVLHGHVDIYSLPGTLPCFDPCGVGSVFTTSTPDGNGYLREMGEPFPNPSTSFSKIPYTLPDGVNEGKILLFDVNGNERKQYTVNRTLHELVISTNELPAGTYWYQLEAQGQPTGGKKIVVIH